MLRVTTFGGVSFSLGDLWMTLSSAARVADENSRPGSVFSLVATRGFFQQHVTTPAGPRRPPSRLRGPAR